MATPYIKIEQKPLRLTPTKTEHVYTVLGPTEITDLTDFRYVFDLWWRPYAGSGGWYPSPAEYSEFITRVKVKPNSFNKGIIDVSKLIENKIRPNIKSEQYYEKPSGSNQAAKYSPNNTIPTSDYMTFVNSNAFTLPRNGYSFNSYYDDEWHIEEYRLLVGYEYRNSNGELVLKIDDEAYKPETIFSSQATTLPASWGGADNTGVEWSNVAIHLNDWNQRVSSWKHTDASETVIISQGSTPINTLDYSYVSTNIPDCGDILVVTEEYSGYSEVYEFSCQPGEGQGNVVGWVFLENRYRDVTDASLSPASVTVWPARVNNNTVSRGAFWEGQSDVNKYGTDGHLNYNVLDYFMNPDGVTEEYPGKFLVTAGSDYSTKTLHFEVDNLNVKNRIRTRKHHRDCPILISFFNTNVIEFMNDVYAMTITSESPGYYIAYNVNTNAMDSEVDGGGPRQDISWSYISSGLYSSKYKLQYLVANPEVFSGNKNLYFWATKYSAFNNELIDYNQTGISEILEYELVESDCVNNPIHFVFLNDQGVWDTYTFDKKSQKTYEIDKKSFKKGISFNKNAYQRIDSKSSNEVYYNRVEEVVTAQSWYMPENDRSIVEQLYRSSDVYILSEYEDGFTDSPLGPNGHYKYKSVIPVVIEDRKVDEYKKNYEKLFQYTITFRYTPIKDFNSAR